VDLSAATEQSGNQPPPHWPAVADYWPDPTAVEEPDPAPVEEKESRPAEESTDDGITWIGAPDGPPGRSGRSRLRLVLGGALAAALLVITGGVLATLVKQAHSETTLSGAPEVAPATVETVPVPTGAATVAPAPKSAAPAVTSATRAVAPPKPPATAIFELATSMPAVTLHTGDLGADLYRVTAKDSAVVPRISVTGNLYRLTLAKKGKPAAAAVDVTLDAGTRWTLRISAGNNDSVLNLSDGRLAAVEMAGGSHDLELRLPKASGSLAVRVTKGANKLKINTAGDPVRLSLRAGVGKVVLDGDTHKGNGPGKVFTSDGFAKAGNRVDLEATAGLGTLVVDTD